ncbi:ABC transporter ATP-binding protein/permease [Pseudochelatococcus sp. B33]
MLVPLVLRRIARLLRLCIVGEGGRLAALYFVVVIALGFIGITVSIWQINWNADFYNALQKVDGPEIVRQIGIFGVITTTTAALYLSGRYILSLAQIRWRRSLTEAALDRWLGNKAYWHLRAGNGAHPTVDNPDQRIAEDCRLFVELVTDRGTELINSVVAVVSYFVVLWSLSTFALSFTIFGFTVEIPRYMVWAAPVYVLLSSLATHWLGAPLKRLHYTQQKREADFRFALVHMREANEAIALQDGEEAERRILGQRFHAIMANWYELIRRDLILGCFTRPFMQTVLRIPTFLALPAFIAGKLTLGGLMQVASAFSNVVTTLSWFIFKYRDLAELAATASRLDQFMTATEEAAGLKGGLTVVDTDADVLRVRGVTLRNPEGGVLLKVPDFSVARNEVIWIKGSSGLGKSTLLKAIAGLWPYGEGLIERPRGRRLFLPQHPYLPLDNLAAAVTYPLPAGSLSPGDMETWLANAGLAGRIAEVHAAEPATTAHRGLSGGELQRLMLLRAIAGKPDWVFLDEPTSALDPHIEERTLIQLRQALPDASLIIVAHRPPAGLAITRCIDMEAVDGRTADAALTAGASLPI